MEGKSQRLPPKPDAEKSTPKQEEKDEGQHGEPINAPTNANRPLLFEQAQEEASEPQSTEEWEGPLSGPARRYRTRSRTPGPLERARSISQGDEVREATRVTQALNGSVPATRGSSERSQSHVLTRSRPQELRRRAVSHARLNLRPELRERLGLAPLVAPRKHYPSSTRRSTYGCP